MDALLDGDVPSVLTESSRSRLTGGRVIALVAPGTADAGDGGTDGAPGTGG